MRSKRAKRKNSGNELRGQKAPRINQREKQEGDDEKKKQAGKKNEKQLELPFEETTAIEPRAPARWQVYAEFFPRRVGCRCNCGKQNASFSVRQRFRPENSKAA
jgi:hypothetical protein